MLVADNQKKTKKKKDNLELKDKVAVIGYKERLSSNKERKLSSQQWLLRQLNDSYVKAAKRDGYYSRSAYKLIEIDKRYHILKSGMKVVDLGAAPGGWSQVVAKTIFKDRKIKQEQYNDIIIIEDSSTLKDTGLFRKSSELNISSCNQSNQSYYDNKQNVSLFKIPSKESDNRLISTNKASEVLEDENNKDYNHSQSCSADYKAIGNEEQCGSITDHNQEDGGVFGLVDSKKNIQNLGSRLISVDLLDVNPIDNATRIKGDFTNKEVLNTIQALIGENKIDLVLSDMAPNTVGSKAIDHIRIMNLVGMAYDFARENLAEGGIFVAKVFQGGTTIEILNQIKQDFKDISHFKPDATRKESNEIYLIARGFKSKSL